MSYRTSALWGPLPKNDGTGNVTFSFIEDVHTRRSQIISFPLSNSYSHLHHLTAPSTIVISVIAWQLAQTVIVKTVVTNDIWQTTIKSLICIRTVLSSHLILNAKSIQLTSLDCHQKTRYKIYVFLPFIY